MIKNTMRHIIWHMVFCIFRPQFDVIAAVWLYLYQDVLDV